MKKNTSKMSFGGYKQNVTTFTKLFIKKSFIKKAFFLPKSKRVVEFTKNVTCFSILPWPKEFTSGIVNT